VPLVDLDLLELLVERGDLLEQRIGLIGFRTRVAGEIHESSDLLVEFAVMWSAPIGRDLDPGSEAALVRRLVLGADIPTVTRVRCHLTTVSGVSDLALVGFGFARDVALAGRFVPVTLSDHGDDHGERHPDHDHDRDHLE